MSEASSKMYVIKRNGRRETVMFDKITSRISKLCYGLDMNFIDPISITQKVVNGLYPGVTTVELDNLAAEISASMTSNHHEYAILAARIAISNLHKETKKNFSEVIESLHRVYDNDSKTYISFIAENVYQTVIENAAAIDSAIIYDRDYR